MPDLPQSEDLTRCDIGKDRLEDEEHPNKSQIVDSRLLCLPAEIRSSIFAYVLEDVRCRRPLIVWDEIYLSISGRSSAITTAILLACWTTYIDCISLLYNLATVEISIRSDCFDSNFPRYQSSLGTIGDCILLSRLRHVEIEITYNASSGCALRRLTERILQLAKAFKESQKLNTMILIFFDQGLRARGSPADGTRNADQVLEASMQFECEKFVGISRNLAARVSMSDAKWKALRSKAHQGVIEDIEAFREVNYNSWEHAFSLKN